VRIFTDCIRWRQIDLLEGLVDLVDMDDLVEMRVSMDLLIFALLRSTRTKVLYLWYIVIENGIDTNIDVRALADLTTNANPELTM
jgi:hypothetical protein